MDKPIKTIIVIILCLLCATGCKEKRPDKQKKALHVHVVKIKPTKVPVFRDYIGMTQSIAKVDIRARVKGFLVQRKFEEGTIVEKGDLLFVIDPRPFQAELDLAKGDLERSIAEKQFQQVQYVLFQNLIEQD